MQAASAVSLLSAGVNSYRAGFDMGDEWGLVGEAIGGVINYDRGIPKFRCAGACPWPDPVRAPATCAASAAARFANVIDKQKFTIEVDDRQFLYYLVRCTFSSCSFV